MTMWQPKFEPDKGPLYKSIADALERDIRAGALRPGTRLPTHRDLADELGVTVGTVTRSYSEAERRGLIQGTVGRGTYVNADAGVEDGMVAPGEPLGADGDFGLLEMGLVTPFHGLEPSVADGLKRLARRSNLQELMRYGDYRGSARHREAGSSWLKRFGIEAPSADVLVASGGQHALNLCCMALMRAGERVAVDTLTYPGFKTLAEALGIKPVPVEGDPEGMEPEALDRACRRDRLKAVYLMPAVHNPTTRMMSEARRRTVAEVARRHGLWIIEDDAYLMTRPGSPPPLAVYAPERSIFISSLTKVVAGGLRVAFLHAPREVYGLLGKAVLNTIWMAPPLMVELACLWIESGEAEESLQRKLAEAEKRNALAVEILSAGGGLESEGFDTGFFRWLDLPEHWTGSMFELKARERGIKVFCAEKFAVGGDPVRAAVRLSMSGPSSLAELGRGLNILRQIALEPNQGPAMAGPML